MLVLLILTLLVHPSLQVITEENCKSEELFYFYDDQCFYLNKDLVYWDYAKNQCASFRFVPAVVRTVNDITHFTTECVESISIGATDEYEEGVFKWIETLQPISSEIASLITNMAENDASKNCLMGTQDSTIRIVSCSKIDAMCTLCTERNDTNALMTTTAASETSNVVKTTAVMPTTTSAAAMNGHSLILLWLMSLVFKCMFNMF